MHHGAAGAISAWGEMVHCAALHAPYGWGACVGDVGRRETPSRLRCTMARQAVQAAVLRQGEANPALDGIAGAAGQRGVSRGIESDLGLGKEPLQLFGSSLGQTFDLGEAEAAGAESGVEFVERA